MSDGTIGIESSKPNFGLIMRKVAAPVMTGIGFYLREKKRSTYTFCDDNIERNCIVFSAHSAGDAFACMLVKDGTKLPAYYLSHIAIAVIDDDFVKILQGSDGYFYYETESELRGALEFAITLLHKCYEGFFHNDYARLVDAMMQKKSVDAKEAVERIGELAFAKLAVEQGDKWRKMRFEAPSGSDPEA